MVGFPLPLDDMQGHDSLVDISFHLCDTGQYGKCKKLYVVADIEMHFHVFISITIHFGGGATTDVSYHNSSKVETKNTYASGLLLAHLFDVGSP